MWGGFSVYRIEIQARNKARGLRLGDYMVELTIPVGSAITYERTGSTRGHHTIWGSSWEIEQCVTSVVGV